MAHNKKHYGRTFYIPEDQKACEEWLSKEEMEKEARDWLAKQSIEWKEEKITAYKEEERQVTSDAYAVACCAFDNINFDFYVMSTFDSELCKEIKGNAVILTDINTVYFVINDEVLLKDDKPLAVETINRQSVPMSTSGLPAKVTSPRDAINKIVGESVKKGRIRSGAGRLLSFVGLDDEIAPYILAIPGVGCSMSTFTIGIVAAFQSLLMTMCFITAPARLCCNDDVNEFLAPSMECSAQGEILVATCCCHSFCCVLPWKASFLQTESVPYETSIQRVAMPEVAGRTLFGEAAAIRDMQQRLGISASRELSEVPPRMDMQ